MSSQIKFIFFDMGKVLLEFDHKRLIKQVAELADKPIEETEQILFHSPHDLENRFEKGEFDATEFHRTFCEVADCDVDQRKLMLAVSDIFWLNTSIVNLLTQLRGLNFPMAILSNTCSAHWEFAKENFPAVGQLFSHRVLSYEEKSMKPDAKIYDSAIVLAKRLVDCQPNEMFFVDDRQENVDAACKAGMQAELYVTSRQLSRQLAEGGVPVF